MLITLGQLVQVRAKREKNDDPWVDYPGVVYKLYPGTAYVGVMVIWDGAPTRYGKLPFSKEPKELHWSNLQNSVNVEVIEE